MITVAVLAAVAVTVAIYVTGMGVINRPPVPVPGIPSAADGSTSFYVVDGAGIEGLSAADGFGSFDPSHSADHD